MTDIRACHCTECGKTTSHIVYKERLLAAVLWCRQCFSMTVDSEREFVTATPVRAFAPAARSRRLEPQASGQPAHQCIEM
ncbi:MAG: hypothetical protein M0006_09365 [Magnetospirillum sp.]|nr:hypothetical protein [Magnetospirillum sp.]